MSAHDAQAILSALQRVRMVHPYDAAPELTVRRGFFNDDALPTLTLDIRSFPAFP